VWGCWVGWQDETTQRAVARKKEQRRQTAQQPCNRARSGLTQVVSMTKGTNLNIHAASRELRSGQLPFLGLFLNKSEE